MDEIIEALDGYTWSHYEDFSYERLNFEPRFNVSIEANVRLLNDEIEVEVLDIQLNGEGFEYSDKEKESIESLIIKNHRI